MEVSDKREGNVVVLSAAGRIDHQTADAFQNALEPHLANCAADGDSLVIDLAEVNYVSSVGLRALLLASKKASARKGKIAVAGMQPTVAEVFRISRFDSILPAYESVSAAVEAQTTGGEG